VCRGSFALCHSFLQVLDDVFPSFLEGRYAPRFANVEHAMLLLLGGRRRGRQSRLLVELKRQCLLAGAPIQAGRFARGDVTRVGC
jgi:hypothetical protein